MKREKFNIMKKSAKDFPLTAAMMAAIAASGVSVQLGVTDRTPYPWEIKTVTAEDDERVARAKAKRERRANRKW